MQLYMPLVVLRITGVKGKDVKPPVGAVVLLSDEKVGKIVIGKRGNYFVIDNVKYYIDIVDWEKVRKRRIIYVWE